MQAFYTKKSKGKSAAAKKYKAQLTKINDIHGEKLNMVIDEYFWKVCYEFFKREMRVWILLSIKYLKISKVSNKDRKFMTYDHKTNIDAEATLNSDNPMLQGLVAERNETFVGEDDAVASYPVEFTYSESLRLNEDTRRITHSLDNIFKGTATAEAVGKIASDDAEEKKEVDPRHKPYEFNDVNFTSERTNLMSKIISVTGFTTKKDAKKAAKDSTSPPKAKGAGKSIGATAGKSGGKKKAAAGKQNVQLEPIVVITKEMCPPIFRYIPDRGTIQRLILKCAAIKDDVIKFEPYEKAEDAKDGNDLI